MTRILRRLALPATLAATLALASCGTTSNAGGHDMPGPGDLPASASSASSGTGAAGAKNPADVVFATGMIPHHAQAVEMADMALRQATDAKVKALAPKIKAAQAPEIAGMSGWLKGWGAPVPGTAGGHDMSGMGGHMNGMMSDKEMTDLGKAAGSAFDRMWLQMMIRHHTGALTMAGIELAQGANPESKQLARAIIDGQSAEITQMKSILNALPR